MRFGSKNVLGPEHVGRRVTVRRALPEGGKSDTIGILSSFGETEVVVVDRTGTHVRIARADIVAARVIEQG